MLGKDELIYLYRDRALRYDLASNLYRLIGLRISTYRQQAADSLALRSGDTVVELGCGTGLNFPDLYQAVGPTGTIIGADLTDAMLAQAQKCVRREGWSNVNLVQSDVAAFTYPEPVDGILSTFALTLVPEFDEVIRQS